MAAGVAAINLRPVDTGARFRTDRMQELRKRNASTLQKNASLGNLSDIANQKTANNPGATAGEMYQRAFRQRQLFHQIGENVGLVLDRRSKAEDTDEITESLNQTALDEANLQLNNQLGLDLRSRAAKQATRAFIQSSGLDKGLEMMATKAATEVGALGIQLFSAADEVIGAPGEFLYIDEALDFAQNQIQAIRTILPMSQDLQQPDEITNLAEIRQSVEATTRKSLKMMLDIWFPRLNLRSPAGLIGLLKAIMFWLLIPFGIINMAIVILLPFLITGGIIYFAGTALYTFANFFSF